MTGDAYMETAAEGVPVLLDAIASFGENLGASDTFVDLGSGLGKLVLQVFLTTDVGRAVGIEIIEERHHLASMARKAALGLGPTIYAVGMDGKLYAQRLDTMLPHSHWTLISSKRMEMVTSHHD